MTAPAAVLLTGAEAARASLQIVLRRATGRSRGRCIAPGSCGRRRRPDPRERAVRETTAGESATRVRPMPGLLSAWGARAAAPDIYAFT